MYLGILACGMESQMNVRRLCLGCDEVGEARRGRARARTRARTGWGERKGELLVLGNTGESHGLETRRKWVEAQSGRGVRACGRATAEGDTPRRRRDRGGDGGRGDGRDGGWEENAGWARRLVVRRADMQTMISAILQKYALSGTCTLRPPTRSTPPAYSAAHSVLHPN